MNNLVAVLQDLRRQYAENARLRLISLAVLATFWIWGLLAAQDALQPRRAAIAAAQGELDRLQSIEKAEVWQQRGREARERLQAAQALTWVEQRPGLAQAEIQDWLRTLAGKTGLVVRDIRLAAAQEPTSGSSAAAKRAAEHVRVRVSAEFTPLSLVAFLNELGLAERGLVVERMQLKTWTKPTQLDLDIKARLGTNEGQAR